AATTPGTASDASGSAFTINSPGRKTSLSGLRVICEQSELEMGSTGGAMGHGEGARLNVLVGQTSPREAAELSAKNQEQETSVAPLAAAFFGVYDGHDGDIVSEALHQKFHKLV
ncbi:unnamed protein product, partial [Laminaria digitata]